MDKVLVTGAGGFVGARIMQQLNGRYTLVPLPKGLAASGNESALLRFIESAQPTVILHAAAISDTGYCEAHPEESFKANVQLPQYIAKGACEVGAKLVTFSSDQVYAGLTEPGPFTEDTPLHPCNTYGRHKLEAESRVAELLPSAVQLRATWMYDLPGYCLPIRGNFLLNLITAAMRDQPLRFSCKDYRGITYVREVIEMLTLAMKLPGGTYNFGSENDADTYSTALYACDLLGIHPQLEKLDWARSLRMSGSKFQMASGIAFSDSQAGLKKCLTEYGICRQVKESQKIQEKI